MWLLSKKNKRVRTPRVIQMEAVECGAASLGIVLAYHGCYIPLEELRYECGVSRDGANLLNILKAAQRYGLKGGGLKCPYEELKSLHFPVILLWEGRHFVVLEGFGKNIVYVNDPAFGPLKISEKEFQAKYSGVLLQLEKGENFQKNNQKPEGFFKQIFFRLKTIPHLLGFALLTGVCLLLPGFAMPTFLRFFIDTFFEKGLFPWKWVFLLAVLSTVLFNTVITWMKQWITQRLYAKLSIELSSQFLWHMLKLPVDFFSQRYSGEIAYRATLNGLVVDTITSSILFSIIDVALVVFYGVILFLYDPMIASVIVFMGLCSLITMKIIARSRENLFAQLQQGYGKLVGTSIGGIQNIRSIKSSGEEQAFFAQWSGHLTNKINYTQEIGVKDIFLTSLPLLFNLIATALLLGFGSIRISEGRLTLGMLMAMQLFMNSFLQPITRFVTLGQLIQGTKIQLERLSDVLKNKIDPQYQKKKVQSPTKEKLEGFLEFKNVTFGYSRLAEPLLKDFSFQMKPGEHIAIVGPSGGGKSTIAKLAAALLTPWSGEILYDGMPIQEIPRELLNKSIATVDQEIFLFSDTIRKNLTFWNEHIPEEILIRATKQAQIHEEILSRDEGYDSVLIEGGKNLSGGQRQRIEIARAFIYNPSILLLDEATSALDSTSEKLISDQIKQRSASALIIAQRLSTIRDADLIIVIDRGNEVQRGTHESLKGTAGLYQELINASPIHE